MFSKSDPGAFDCYAKAHPDEPMFILLGRDRHASALAHIWATLRAADGDDAAQIKDAHKCADALASWCRTLGKSPAEFSGSPPLRTEPVAIDLKNSDAQLMGADIFGSLVFPILQRAVRELSHEDVTKLWGGIMSAAAGGLCADLGFERGLAVLAGVHEVADQAKTEIHAATH